MNGQYAPTIMIRQKSSAVDIYKVHKPTIATRVNQALTGLVPVSTTVHGMMILVRFIAQ